MSATLILARWIHFAAAVALVGVFSFRLFVGDPAFREAARTGRQVDNSPFTGRLTQIAVGSLLLIALSGTLWLLLQASVMSGRSISDVLHSGVLRTVLLRTQAGHDWLARTALLVLLALTLTWMHQRHHPPSRAPLIVAFVFASAALSALVWTGHAGAARGARGAVEQTVDAVHLLAAGIWLGGLGPLVLLLKAARRAEHERWLVVAQCATTRFSTLGILSIAGLLGTGIVNSWFLVGSLAALSSTAYGCCLLFKLGLFGITVAVATVNRTRLVPRFSAAHAFDPEAARGKTLRELQRNSAVELGLGVLILGVVAALGTLPPAAHPHTHVSSKGTPERRNVAMRIGFSTQNSPPPGAGTRSEVSLVRIHCGFLPASPPKGSLSAGDDRRL